MPNTKPQPARRAAPPPRFPRLQTILDHPATRAVVTHPLWIGLALLGMATVCGWSTMIVAATVANWMTR